MSLNSLEQLQIHSVCDFMYLWSGLGGGEWCGLTCEGFWGKFGICLRVSSNISKSRCRRLRRLASWSISTSIPRLQAYTSQGSWAVLRWTTATVAIYPTYGAQGLLRADYQLVRQFASHLGCMESARCTPTIRIQKMMIVIRDRLNYYYLKFVMHSSLELVIQ